MKKFLVIILLLIGFLPANAIQKTLSDGSPINSMQEGKSVKLYDKYGSLQSTYKPQQNGSTRVYNKYGSYQGQYRQSGSKLKYYPKR